MRELLRNSTFHLAFGWSMIAFLAINLLVHFVALYHYQNPSDSEIRFADAGGFVSGFPFTMYAFGGGNPFYSYWIWLGLIGNLLVAVAASFAVGFLWVRWTFRKKELQ